VKKTGWHQSIALSLTLALACLPAGCTTRSKARANADAAFHAGQQRAMIQAHAEQNGITFTGPVLRRIVPWTEGITLAEVIAAAQWSGLGDPQLVIVTRGSGRVEMTPAEVLAAAQFLMEPGDKVEMLP